MKLLGFTREPTHYTSVGSVYFWERRLLRSESRLLFSLSLLFHILSLAFDFFNQFLQEVLSLNNVVIIRFFVFVKYLFKLLIHHLLDFICLKITLDNGWNYLWLFFFSRQIVIIGVIVLKVTVETLILVVLCGFIFWISVVTLEIIGTLKNDVRCFQHEIILLYFLHFYFTFIFSKIQIQKLLYNSFSLTYGQWNL